MTAQTHAADRNAVVTHPVLQIVQLGRLPVEPLQAGDQGRVLM